MSQALYHYILGGITCNQNEYAYYERTHDVRVMPTRQIFFWGWLIVQDRGAPVSQREMLFEYPFGRDLLLRDEIDMNTAKQFARHRNGRVLLVDYGTLQACGALEDRLVFS